MIQIVKLLIFAVFPFSQGKILALKEPTVTYSKVELACWFNKLISILSIFHVLAAIATSGFDASITPEDLKNFLVGRPDLQKRGFRQIEIPAMPPRLNALNNDKRSEYGIDDYLQF